MADVTFSWQDKIVSGYGRALGRLSAGDGAAILSRAINHEGAKATTAVRRALRESTGLGKYGFAKNAVKSRRASQFSLQFEISASGRETNIGEFGAKQTKAGVTAWAWGKRRTFPHTFIKNVQNFNRPMGETKDRVFVRSGASRLPIRNVWGPNIARELIRGPVTETFNDGLSGLPKRVGHELERFLMAAARTSW